MTENMKAFLDAISNNEDLKEKVDEINEKEEEELKGHIAEYISLAKETGITLTEEDFRQDNRTELSDDELQAVAGGINCFIGGGGGDRCVCIVIGSYSMGTCIWVS